MKSAGHIVGSDIATTSVERLADRFVKQRVMMGPNNHRMIGPQVNGLMFQILALSWIGNPLITELPPQGHIV